jgi:prevent-host-death family protein
LGTATDAARNFADLLDAVEHRGERFTIVRRGKVVAQLDPLSTGRGEDVKLLLRRHQGDLAFATDIASGRELFEIDVRP